MRPWKESHVDTLEQQADELDIALAQLDVVHEMLEQRGADKLAGEVRALAGGLRAEQNDIRAEARQLRATDRELEPRAAGFPFALTAPATTRHPRGAS